MTSIGHLRNDYQLSQLNRSDLSDNPIKQFENWLHEAIARQVQEPTAMTLSTVNEEGFPQSRIVLLKDVSDNGFTFFTNYGSHKGKQLAFNNRAALNFFWPLLERQVRITGIVEKLSAATSQAYFDSRPYQSRLAAWASPQSQIVDDRSVLENYQQMESQYNEASLKCPPHWGGYIVMPLSIEFWQGRENRLHDRFLYEKLSDDKWTINRLAP
jgi:pyridoxamine 5'-phosphate oxidase